jgi:hypothetical protein
MPNTPKIFQPVYPIGNDLHLYRVNRSKGKKMNSGAAGFWIFLAAIINASPAFLDTPIGILITALAALPVQFFNRKYILRLIN